MIPYLHILHIYSYMGFAFISGIRPNRDLFSIFSNSSFTHISDLRLRLPFLFCLKEATSYTILY